MANHFRSTERQGDDLNQGVQGGQAAAYEPQSASDDMEAAIDAVLYQDRVQPASQPAVQQRPVVDIPVVPTAEELEAQPQQSAYAALADAAHLARGYSHHLAQKRHPHLSIPAQQARARRREP